MSTLGTPTLQRDVGQPGRRDLVPRPAEQAGEGGRAFKVGVVFASKGRAAVLGRSVEILRSQSRLPDVVVLSYTSPSDVGDLVDSEGIVHLRGEAGLARQRNAGLAALRGTSDIIVFFDDDFIAHPDWLKEVEQTFARHADIVAITGTLVADGIKGPGLSAAVAADLLSRWSRHAAAIVENYSPYGCNMAFRMSAIDGLVFDERLSSYGWLEDRDFGGALRRRGGRLVKLGTALGVHLGTKSGRVSGKRLGYSQIANPLYMRRKGTMTRWSVIDHLFRNVTSNLVLSAWSEPFVDRRGRLVGNLIALKDLLLRRLAPERIEHL